MNGTAETIPSPDQYPANPIPEPRTDNRPATGGGRKPWWQDPIIREKYNAFQLLRSEGFSTTKAAEAIGYSPSYGEVIDGNIKKFEARKAESGSPIDFLTDKRIKRASVVVDTLMRGKAFGDIREVKDSTALRAAETVLDRQYPKQSQGVAPALSFVTINLGAMTASPEPERVIGQTVELQAMGDGADLIPLGDGI
jgi:hypothetical protein